VADGQGAGDPGQVRYRAPPRWLMRLFAPEFYKMRVAFEAAGRTPIRPRSRGRSPKRWSW